MSFVEKYLIGKNFDLQLKVKSGATGETVFRVHVANCNVTFNKDTGYTELVRKGRMYLVFERLLYEDEVFFNEKTNTLFVTLER